MIKKIKGFLSIFFMSLAFFMMVDTRYVRPLGDYVVEFIGLSSWTGDQTGLHLSVIYFAIIFIGLILLVQKYAIKDLAIQARTVFIYFIGLNLLFTLMISGVVRTIKGNSEGLLAIGIEQKSDLTYEFNGKRYIQYDLDITLKNYSDIEQTFYLTVDERDGMGSAQLKSLDTADELFHLSGNEQRRFFLTAEHVVFEAVDLPDYDWANGTGRIDRLILSNERGEKVQLEDRDFLGINLVK